MGWFLAVFFGVAAVVMLVALNRQYEEHRADLSRDVKVRTDNTTRSLEELARQPGLLRQGIDAERTRLQEYEGKKVEVARQRDELAAALAALIKEKQDAAAAASAAAAATAETAAPDPAVQEREKLQQDVDKLKAALKAMNGALTADTPAAGG